MSKFDSNKIIPRYIFFALLLCLVALAVIVKAGYIMTVKRDYWMQVADRVKRDSVPAIPVRGNILSSDGQLLASSLPEFKIFMDFEQLHIAGTDSLWNAKLDSICSELHNIFPQKSPDAFKVHLNEGFSKRKRHWAIWPKRIDYNTYQDVKQLPVFRLSKLKSGFHVEEYKARIHPSGSLAGRTVGDMYSAKDEGRTPRCGLELSYDSLLRGTDGIIQRRKVRNKFLDIMDTPPIDGCDIVTTIDVEIQDLAERAVIEELKKINGNVGVAIVMEVKTGDVKAIVNLDKCFDGVYREVKNHAVSDLLEPGSVFKPLSVMTLLEDGMCDTSKIVDTGPGVWPMYGQNMKDHNWRRGGYGVMNLAKAVKVSSNIGVSRVVDAYYHDNPQKFVEGVYRTGICNLNIPIVGATQAQIRMPKKNERGEWVGWSKTALPWMSIGYETQIPPIATLTVYNAIANDGWMMNPRFVKAAVKNGQVVEEFPPQPVKGHEKIASDQTIKVMKELLTKVVTEGVGKKAGSPAFLVAGKTGTAQISKGAQGYKSGITNYLLTFSGFFPADKPRYSCIVCLQKSGLPASGGGMSGVVFRQIAEGIMAQDLKLDVRDARDSASVLIPDVKAGNILSADYVLAHLGIKTHTNFATNTAANPYVWGFAQSNENSVKLIGKMTYGDKYIPDVHGMGARDAVYLIERRGVKCRIEGRGKVVKQSIPPGHVIKRGEVCRLILE